MTDRRQRPRKGREDDPDLGQKEAEEEKAELEEEGGEPFDPNHGRRLAIILKWSH